MDKKKKDKKKLATVFTSSIGSPCHGVKLIYSHLSYLS